ncbi:MAG: hypothetical protein AABX13_05755 [Nanoarchaeota archaeon]
MVGAKASPEEISTLGCSARPHFDESNLAKAKNKPIELHLQFDSEWKRFYEELGKQYGNPLDYLITT